MADSLDNPPSSVTDSTDDDQASSKTIGKVPTKHCTVPKCHRRISNIPQDPHIVCTFHRGQVCSLELFCDACRYMPSSDRIVMVEHQRQLRLKREGAARRKAARLARAKQQASSKGGSDKCKSGKSDKSDSESAAAPSSRPLSPPSAPPVKCTPSPAPPAPLPPPETASALPLETLPREEDQGEERGEQSAVLESPPLEAVESFVIPDTAPHTAPLARTLCVPPHIRDSFIESGYTNVDWYDPVEVSAFLAYISDVPASEGVGMPGEGSAPEPVPDAGGALPASTPGVGNADPKPVTGLGNALSTPTPGEGSAPLLPASQPRLDAGNALPAPGPGDESALLHPAPQPPLVTSVTVVKLLGPGEPFSPLTDPSLLEPVSDGEDILVLHPEDSSLLGEAQADEGVPRSDVVALSTEQRDASDSLDTNALVSMATDPDLGQSSTDPQIEEDEQKRANKSAAHVDSLLLDLGEKREEYAVSLGRLEGVASSFNEKCSALKGNRSLEAAKSAAAQHRESLKRAFELQRQLVSEEEQFYKDRMEILDRIQKSRDDYVRMVKQQQEENRAWQEKERKEVEEKEKKLAAANAHLAELRKRSAKLESKIFNLENAPLPVLEPVTFQRPDPIATVPRNKDHSSPTAAPRQQPADAGTASNASESVPASAGNASPVISTRPKLSVCSLHGQYAGPKCPKCRVEPRQYDSYSSLGTDFRPPHASDLSRSSASETHTISSEDEDHRPVRKTSFPKTRPTKRPREEEDSDTSKRSHTSASVGGNAPSQPAGAGAFGPGLGGLPRVPKGLPPWKDMVKSLAEAVSAFQARQGVGKSGGEGPKGDSDVIDGPMTTSEMWDLMVKLVPYAFGPPGEQKAELARMFNQQSPSVSSPRARLKVVPLISTSMEKVASRLNRNVEEGKAFAMRPMLPRASGPYTIVDKEKFVGRRVFNTYIHDRLYSSSAETLRLKRLCATVEEVKNIETSMGTLLQVYNFQLTVIDTIIKYLLGKAGLDAKSDSLISQMTHALEKSAEHICNEAFSTSVFCAVRRREETWKTFPQGRFTEEDRKRLLKSSTMSPSLFDDDLLRELDKDALSRFQAASLDSALARGSQSFQRQALPKKTKPAPKSRPQSPVVPVQSTPRTNPQPSTSSAQPKQSKPRQGSSRKSKGGGKKGGKGRGFRS